MRHTLAILPMIVHQGPAAWRLRFGLCILLLFLSTTKARSADSDAIALPNGQTLERVSFHRHVVPLLTRFGCNAAACHGSFQGRGEMQLSLIGHSPQMDFEALSARIDVEDAPESLALLKPTATVDHGGGVRFEKESWPYLILKRWIEQGGYKQAADGELLKLAVDPREILLPAESAPVQLRVQAAFAGNQV